MRTELKPLLATLFAAMVVAGCSAKISGVVKLVDKNMQPIAADTPEGIVVNMINTTSSLEHASHSVKTTKNGEFSSESGKIVPGIYKVEASRIGYKTSTQSIEVGKYSSKKLELFLRKIPEGKRRSVRSKNSDAEKIINPGEVNIQPPSM